MSEDRTFRIRGIPLDWDVSRLQSFLASQDDAAGSAVRSLAEEIHGRSHTATVSYSSVPGSLQTTQPGRTVQMSFLTESDQLGRPQLLTVDDSFHGVTTLHTSSTLDHKIDIIAVAGLGGHAFGSFKQRGGKHMWIRDALPYDLTSEDENPIARIMVYGYESKIAQSDNIQNLEDLGTALHSSLLPLTHGRTLKPIIFVAHSLGGLIIKQAIVSLAESKRDDDQRLARALRGIIFFGVPHHGTDITTLVPMAGDGPNRMFIESLGKHGSQTLHTLRENFHTALKNLDEIEVFCFFETTLSPTAVQNEAGKWEMKGPPAVLVTKESATHWHQEKHSSEHICAINRNHSEMVKFGPEDPEYDKALSRIMGLIRYALKTHSATLNENATQDGHWLVPFGRNKDFVGREDILEEVVRRASPNAEKDDCQRIVIEGLGGVGKTQIVLESAFRIQKLHPNCSIFWVPAMDASSFENAFREIGRQLQIERIDDEKGDVRSLVQKALSQSRDEWLLVIDNADDVELFCGKDALREHLPFSRKGSILLTTRNHELVGKLSVRSSNVINVSGMSESEAIKLFRSSLGAQKIHDSQAIVDLLDFLAYLPLAIRQAAVYIYQTRISVTRYLELCQSSDAAFIKLLGKDFEDLGRYKNTKNPVATTWLISFQQISRDNPCAIQQLQMMSVLADDVPKSLLPPGEDEIELEEAIGTLKAYAFISEQVDETSYQMHRLVRIAMQNWLAERGELRRCVTEVVQRLSDVFPSPTHENRHIWASYLPHGMAALDLGQHSTNDAAKARLLANLAESNQDLGKYKLAEKLYRQALELQTKLLGGTHPETLSNMNGVARALFSLGSYDQSEVLYRKIFQLRKRVSGAKSPGTIGTMNDLALALREQGKLKQADDIHGRTLKLHQEMLGAEHPDTLRSMSDFADTLREGGKYREAEELYQQTLKLRMRVHGPDHPKTLDTMCNLALSFHAQGRFDEAAKVHRRTLDQRLKILGLEHPETLSSMNNFAYTLRGQSKIEEAEALDWQTLELRIKVLGAEHPDTFWSMNGLANGFRSQGKYEQAELMYRQTLELRNKVLGKRHHNTFDSMDNLASILGRQGKYKEAENLYREALELGTIVRGADHPHTLDSMNGVAYTLYGQRDLEKAETMFWETLELRTKVHGIEHPHTLETLHGLALTLHAQEKHEEAKKMHQMTFDLRNKTLGAEHLDTLQSLQNLKLVSEGCEKQEEKHELSHG